MNFMSEEGKLYQRVILEGGKTKSDAEVEMLRNFLFETYRRAVIASGIPLAAMEIIFRSE